MNLQDWNELYRKLYDAYAYAGLRDEYVRSTLGDALDHMNHLKELRVKEQRAEGTGTRSLDSLW
jgi:hypothetical protein